MSKPYIISAELDLGLGECYTTLKPEGIDDFRASLDADLQKQGKATLWLPAQTMRDELERRVQLTRIPTVSLDDRYVRNADAYIGISRSVTADMNDASYMERVGYGKVSAQIGAIASIGSEVVIVDDVLFSGEMLTWLSDRLESAGVTVCGVICGVAIREGWEKLTAAGIGVDSLYAYDEVEDEICERDFAIVKGSGRRMDGEQNALYFDTKFGKPSEWASLDEAYAPEFLQQSLVRSLALTRDSAQMGEVGAIYGYQQNGSVKQAILKRMEEL